eukprot:g4512.t1
MGGGASTPAAHPSTNSISFEGDDQARGILERIAQLPSEQANEILGRASALVQSLLPASAPAEGASSTATGAASSSLTTTTTTRSVLQSVDVSVVSASSMRGTDGWRGRGDPYVVATFTSSGGEEGEQLFTSTVRNNHVSPAWNEVLSFSADANAGLEAGGGAINIQVWDQDTSRGPNPGGGRDDLLGEVNLSVDDIVGRAGGSRPTTFDLTGRRAQGTLTLGFSVSRRNVVVEEAAPSPGSATSEAAPEPEPSPVPAPRPNPRAVVVTRREIREMPRRDQQRFVAAILEMMRSGEYFRVAGYHGWPNDFCAHRQEHFPAWHRAYLTDVERALVAADIALGNDGQVGLPYWDWTQMSVNGEGAYPSIIREHFSTIPDTLAEQIRSHSSGGGSALLERGYALHSDSRIGRNLRRANLTTKVRDALLEAEHWRFASTRWGGGTSLESPHNDVHVACGYPMTSVNFAAFHPIFFLHHCNVDRILSRYLTMEVDSRNEFAARQRSLAERGETNRFEISLDPFQHPLRPAESLHPRDTFDTRGLGYAYDALPERPARRLRQLPVLALFRGVDPVRIKPKSFLLHVFVVRKGEDAASWSPPKEFTAGGVQELDTGDRTIESPEASDSPIPGYAGAGSVFGGKGSECANCRESEPINIVVDIGAALRNLSTSAGVSLSRYDVELRVVCEDEAGAFKSLDEAIDQDGVALVRPTIEGPLFEDPEGTLTKAGDTPAEWGASVPSEDIQHVQQWLRLHGYYDGVADGKFGPKTESAVRDFQAFVGITEEHGGDAPGVVGKTTKRFISAPRMDHEKDAGAQDRTHYTAGQTVHYAVGWSPGYLDRGAVLKDVDEAVAMWSAATGVKMERIDTAALKGTIVGESKKVGSGAGGAGDVAGTVEISWVDNSGSADNLLRFDGPGGTLAQAGKNFVHLDAAELWGVRGAPTKPGAFMIFSVVLHEMGHVMGLAHSKSADDVMSPYYRPELVALTENDASRAKAVCSA